METLSVTFAGDPQTYHVITDCKESDTCPGCGAGYKAGLIECEYCRRPVRFATGCSDWKHKCVAVPPETEAYYSQLYEEEFAASLQRLAGKAQMVHRDDGTTGFTF